ncbi:hypothetical protein WG66_014882, partial [Moniliophthora roreri]
SAPREQGLLSDTATYRHLVLTFHLGACVDIDKLFVFHQAARNRIASYRGPDNGHRVPRYFSQSKECIGWQINLRFLASPPRLFSFSCQLLL